MTEPRSQSASLPERAACLGLFLVVLVTSLWFARAGWKNAVLDTHPFRQTQTAMSTYWMIRDGFHLDYETPIMGPPWSIPLEFPVYEAAVAAVCRSTGLPLDQAGRAVSLCFFYAALPAVWLLLRRLKVTPAHRWLFLALILTCPVYQFFSRAFLIESTAFCLGLWFLNFFHSGLVSGRRSVLAAAALFGAAAGLAKVTTYAVFLAPAAAFAVAAWRAHRTEWRALLTRAAVAAVPGILAAAWWVRHSDAVKRKNILGASLVSSELHDWTYGPLAQRFDPGFWRQFGVQIERALFPACSLFLLAVLLLLFLRGRVRQFAVILLVAMAGPLVFANLYFVHDYYLYSSGIFFLLLLALPLQRLMETAALPLSARLGVIVVVLAAQFSGYLEKYYEPQSRQAGGPPDLALAIGQVTQPDDLLVGFGLDWSPILPYYSHRRALLVPKRYIQDDAVIREALHRARPARIAAVLLFRLGQPGPEAYAHWLKELEMDENPFLQTGEYTVHLRKDMIPDALKALKDFPLHDVLLYQGQLGGAAEKPRILYWVDQLKDRSIFADISPQPLKLTVPYGLASPIVEGHHWLISQPVTEIEIVPPPGARHITAEFGMDPAIYDRSDGVEFEVLSVQPNGYRQRLYYRWLQPGTIKQDRGLQSFSIELIAPLQGTVVFRTLPGPNNNGSFDWAYWRCIKID